MGFNMNSTIFDKKVSVISTTDLMPSTKIAKEEYAIAGCGGALPLFIIYGVLTGISVKQVKTGEAVKFLGNFESYNQLTGEMLKSNALHCIKLVENLLMDASLHLPENGLEFGYSEIGRASCR